ncbi:MAG: 1-acyl-sn-glycerol-3-phosphate acyltransferase [Saprospiraceae bacterium]|jgi:1-acyl-sn-glycerol-3-phosphate acyltransferase
MIYYVFGTIIRFFFQMFYKRVYLQGFENIPDGKPVILAADHTNALMDPLLVAIFLLKKRPIYFLTRADIFSNKFFIWFFGQIHMQPIYRPRDGTDYTEKNNKTFEEVNRWLLSKKVVLIFPEGSTEVMKRLRPLKKGTVRMGFKAWEDGADVHIVPTGISYTYHHGIRSEAIISYGKPMRLEDYRADFEENPKKAYRLAGQDLFQLIQAEMVVIDKPESEDLVEKMLTIGRNDFLEPRFPIMAINPRRLPYEQRIARKVNELAEADSEGFKELESKANTYFKTINTLSTTDNAVKNYKKANSFMVLLLAPFAKLLAVVLHFPMKYFKEMATKMMVRDMSMFTTIWTGLIMGFYFVFGLVWLILGISFLGLVVGIGSLVIFVFLTYWSGVILENRKLDKANAFLEGVETKSPDKVKALEDMRLELSKWIRS